MAAVAINFVFTAATGFFATFTSQESFAAQANLIAFEVETLDQDLLAFGQFVAHIVHAVRRDFTDVQQA